MFLDNAMKREKPEFDLVAHWTGSSRPEGDLNWLNTRNNGRGSVGYNCIIGKDGARYILADPKTHWMHNTGCGTGFDKTTISIAFSALNAEDKITEDQIKSFREYKAELEEWCTIKSFSCHAELNRNKQDFPAEIWEQLKKKLKD